MINFIIVIVGTNQKELHLIPYINLYADVQQFVRKLWVLAYVPIPDIIKVFEETIYPSMPVYKSSASAEDEEEDEDDEEDDYNHHLAKYVDYFEATWLGAKKGPKTTRAKEVTLKAMCYFIHIWVTYSYVVKLLFLVIFILYQDYLTHFYLLYMGMRPLYADYPHRKCSNLIPLLFMKTINMKIHSLGNQRTGGDAMPGLSQVSGFGPSLVEHNSPHSIELLNSRKIDILDK